MKKLVLIGGVFFSALAVKAQVIDISVSRTYSVGQTVTVSGVATNGSELGTIRYMQDGTGGVAAYGGGLTGIARYDSLTVTGQIADFSGLMELTNLTVVDHGPAVITPQPLEVPIPSITETIESQYIKITNVTFVQTGTFAGNTTYQVTDGTNTLDVRINTSTNIDGTAIPTGALTIFGVVGQFNANYQIVPRDLNDIIAYVAPVREINVKLAGNTVLTGSTYFIGNTASLPVVIENYGVGNLNLSGSSFTGANSADFGSNINTGVIGGSGTGSYALTFTPAGTGSRSATLQIGSDDTDENPYVIYFEGVGTDNLATSPTTNASGLTFSNVQAYTLNGSYTAGTGATKYLVVWKNGSAPTGTPVDGTTYKRGDVVGNGTVAYVGGGTAFTPRGIIANQNYYFAVYAFNGQGGFENYLTTSPATGSVTSGGENIGTYYNGINSTSASFLTNLSALINPHTQISYFNYKQTIMTEFEARDTTDGRSLAICAYSGERKIYNDPFDWTTVNFSREHVYCHSWMPTNPADSPEKPEYTDQHNLLPVNFSNVNSVRSNYPLGEVVTVQSSYLGGKFGTDANGDLVYEPRDDMKGNAARAMMYEAVAYNGISGNDWHFMDPISTFIPYIPYGQDQNVIKNWHFADLPDAYEIARNEYIHSVQGNRNPFIDSVEFACHVNFINAMSYISTPCSLGTEEMSADDLTVWPVPASEEIFAEVEGSVIVSYELVDMQGRVVLYNSAFNAASMKLNVQQLHSGSYILRLVTPNGEAQRKVVIE
jgi:endonuclease I